MPILPDVLTGLPPFQGAPPRVVATLAAHAREVRFATDEVLFLTGSVPRGWWVVLTGNVRVVRGRGSRQHVIHTEGRGGTLGEVPLFAGGNHPATGIAADPTSCALFSLPALRAAMLVDEAVALILLQRLALRVRGLVERLDDRAGRSVRVRLIDFLMDRKGHASRGVFSLGMTQQALAEELGTVRDVVSRELRALARNGIIEPFGGGRYRFRDVTPSSSRTT